MPSDDINKKYQNLLDGLSNIKKALLAGNFDAVEEFHNIHKSILADLIHVKHDPDPELEPMIKEILKEMETTSHIINEQQNDMMEHLNTEAKKKKMINAYVKEE